jgi:hypothetical protein
VADTAIDEADEAAAIDEAVVADTAIVEVDEAAAIVEAAAIDEVDEAAAAC